MYIKRLANIMLLILFAVVVIVGCLLLKTSFNEALQMIYTQVTQEFINMLIHELVWSIL